MLGEEIESGVEHSLSTPKNKFMDNNATELDSNQEDGSPFFSHGVHSFNEGIAFATRSIIAATIFNHILFWIRINKAKDVNQYDGRTWVYEKMSDITKQLPYLSEQQVKDGISVLVKQGYLLKANHSKNKFEKTNWYALGTEEWVDIKKMFAKRSIDPLAKVHRPLREGPQTCSIYKDKDIEKEDIEKEDGGRKEQQAARPPLLSSNKNKKDKDPEVVMVSFGSYVKLKEGEYESSVKQIGKELTDYYIEAINNYVPNSGPYKDYAATIRSWYLRDKAKGSLPSTQNLQGGSEPVSERIVKNRRVCESAEAKLKHRFNSYVYFQASTHKAALVDQNKGMSKEYVYEKIDSKLFKEILLRDLESAFSGSRDFLLGLNKKNVAVGDMISDLIKSMK